MIKVSIIVPVYKTEKYLEKCLNSLVNQTLESIEIIIVNDGSPDDSQGIIDEYDRKYSFVKSFRKKNGGLSDARNFGIGKATGEYIGFVDSDDWVELDMFEKMYNKATRDKSDIVVCDTVEVYENKDYVYKKSFFNNAFSNSENYVIAPPMACSKIYRRTILENVKFEAGILYEDLEMIPSLVIKTSNISFLEEGLYFYFQREGSIMYYEKFDSKLMDIFEVLGSLKSKLPQYESEVEYLYITHLLRSATLRFSKYKEAREHLNEIVDIFKREYPNWKKNKYYKESNYRLKIICNLAYRKKYKLLYLLYRIGGK